MGPVSSIRYENLRDGLEDVELIRMAQAGATATMMAEIKDIVASVITGMEAVNRREDPVVLAAARSKLAAIILSKHDNEFSERHVLKSDDSPPPLPLKHDDGLQRGIQFLGKGMEGAFSFDDPRALQSLKNLAATGADHVALTFSWYLNGTSDGHSFRFNSGPIRPIDGPAPSGLNFANCSTPSDRELETIIAAAHSLNMCVKLRPVVQADFPFTGLPSCTLATGGMGCPSQTGVGGGFDAGDFQEFFWGKGGTVTKPAEGSYAYFVYHVAALAERTKAEIVSVSVELSSANGQEAHFRRLIGGVRSIFSGKVHCDVASAPLSSTKAITDVRFWDALDAVGVDAYPALTAGIPANETNPTVAQLVAAFSPVLKLMSDYYHGRFPPAPPPPPLPPPCGLGGHITNFSNLAPHHLAGPSGPNTRWVQYIGVAGTFAECANLCHNRKNCTSWSWHSQDASASSQHCFSRSDGAWQPEYSLGDVCGRVNDTPVPSPPAPSPPTWWPARNKVPIKIVWAENGLISAPNSFRHPGGAYNSAHPDPVCLECQARYYEAFFKAVLCNPDAHEWFGGVYWWKWSSDPNPWSDDGAVGNNRASGNNSDFFPQHKPAEKVLAKYYHEGCPLPLKTDDDATLEQDSLPSLECELNGIHTGAECQCFGGWMGPTCGTLDLLPGTVIWPAHHPDIGSQQWWGDGNTPSAWGGTIQHDHTDGKFHLVAATGCYLPARIMHMDGWQISSGVADKVDGPYTYQSLVTKTASAFGPHSAQLPDGRFILFFEGASTVPTASGYTATCTGNESRPKEQTASATSPQQFVRATGNCTKDDCYNADCQPQNYGKKCDVCSNAGCVCDPGFGECYPPAYNETSSIQVRISNSMSGPWQDITHIRIQGMDDVMPIVPRVADNISPLVIKNSSSPSGYTIYLAFRFPGSDSWCGKARCAPSVIGLAKAEHWSGPYVSQGRRDAWPSPDSVIPYIGDDFNRSNYPSKCFAEGQCDGGEDPTLFIGRNGTFHLLFHKYTNGWAAVDGAPGWPGLHAFSKDGKNWHVSPQLDGKGAYSFLVPWAKGGSTLFARRERPELTVDPVTGSPLWLNTGCQLQPNNTGGAGCKTCQYSFVVLQKVRHQSQRSMKSDDGSGGVGPACVVDGVARVTCFGPFNASPAAPTGIVTRLKSDDVNGASLSMRLLSFLPWLWVVPSGCALSTDDIYYVHSSGTSHPPYANRTLTSVLHERLSVRDFGAKGDCLPQGRDVIPLTTCIHDDTAAFKAALDYAHAARWEGGVVFVPPGEYRIDGTIDLYNTAMHLQW